MHNNMFIHSVSDSNLKFEKIGSTTNYSNRIVSLNSAGVRDELKFNWIFEILNLGEFETLLHLEIFIHVLLKSKNLHYFNNAGVEWFHSDITTVKCIRQWFDKKGVEYKFIGL